MSIRNTTITQLRQMADQEGLVLQGCGGSLQEWQDGINQLLTEEGILQGGTKFEDVCVFQNEGCTCLLFPFTPEVQLDMRKLALWRIRSSEQFGGMWLSDYVDIMDDDIVDDDESNCSEGCLCPECEARLKKYGNISAEDISDVEWLDFLVVGDHTLPRPIDILDLEDTDE